MTELPELYHWLVLVAIAFGPLVGVWVTRAIDARRENEKRRRDILEGLIKTRGLELSPDHVSNLNLVPLYFSEQNVRAQFSKVMEALADGALSSTDPEVSRSASHRVNAARNDLISDVAKAVGTPLPEKEMERFGYAPVAWERQFHEQELLRQLLIETFSGNRALHTLTGIWELPPPDPQGSSMLVENSCGPFGTAPDGDIIRARLREIEKSRGQGKRK